MLKHLTAWSLVGMFALLCLPTDVLAQMSFDKVEGRTAYRGAEEGQKGRLIVDGDAVRFVNSKNSSQEYFSIPSDAINDVFYSRVSGRRIKAALFLLGPLGLFLKGKKHYMTLSFNDGVDIVGAVEFKLDKKNYRGIMRAVEQVSGVELVFDQEGIKDEEETVASRSGGAEAANLATIAISSNPVDAEIEIDGAFAGTTPRLKKLEPGEYKIKIMMDGYKSWERKIRVLAGEEIPISVELKKGY
jgi:hypothetical protein